MAKKYKYTTARQVGGDDGYCWVVFVNGKERVNGLMRREVGYYRDKFEKEESAKANGSESSKQHTWYEITKMAGNCTFYRFAEAIKAMETPGRVAANGDRVWTERETRDIVEQILRGNGQKV